MNGKSVQLDIFGDNDIARALGENERREYRRTLEQIQGCSLWTGPTTGPEPTKFTREEIDFRLRRAGLEPLTDADIKS